MPSNILSSCRFIQSRMTVNENGSWICGFGGGCSNMAPGPGLIFRNRVGMAKGFRRRECPGLMSFQDRAAGAIKSGDDAPCRQDGRLDPIIRYRRIHRLEGHEEQKVAAMVTAQRFVPSASMLWLKACHTVDGQGVSGWISIRRPIGLAGPDIGPPGYGARGVYPTDVFLCAARLHAFRISRVRYQLGWQGVSDGLRPKFKQQRQDSQ